MERIIKFRAWDEGNNVMHSNVQFITSGDGENDWIAFTSAEVPCRSDGGAGLIFDNPFCRQQIKLMQYIGKKDANGAEIYEGDIVKAVSTNYQWPCQGVVEYLSKSASYGLNVGPDYLNEDKSENLYAHFWTHENFEVIGNIYETRTPNAL